MDWGEIGCFALIFWIFFSSKRKQQIKERAREQAVARRDQAWDEQLRRADDIAAGRAERPVGPAWVPPTTPPKKPRQKLNVDPMTNELEIKD